MSATVRTVRDDEFIEGVMSRRCLAWLVDLVLICLLLVVPGVAALLGIVVYWTRRN